MTACIVVVDYIIWLKFIAVGRRNCHSYGAVSCIFNFGKDSRMVMQSILENNSAVYQRLGIRNSGNEGQKVKKMSYKAGTRRFRTQLHHGKAHTEFFKKCSEKQDIDKLSITEAERHSH